METHAHIFESPIPTTGGPSLTSSAVPHETAPSPWGGELTSHATPKADIVGALAGLAALGIAAWLAKRVHTEAPPSIDLAVRTHALATPETATRVLHAIGWFGYPGVYMPTAAAVVWMLRDRERTDAAAVAGATLGGWIAYRLAKIVVDRERPWGDGDKTPLAAYPSGHTAGASAVTFAATCVLARAGMLAPVPAALLAVGLPVAVGTSRVTDEQHWTTDVVGGLLVGAGVAAVALSAAGMARRA